MTGITEREEQLIIVTNELVHIKDDIAEIKQGLHDHMEEEEEYRTILNKRVGILGILMGMNLAGLDGQLLVTIFSKFIPLFL